ncbi:MAG TPA: hypothetical protein VGM93_09600 [Acidimicrobiales bacterium]
MPDLGLWPARASWFTVPLLAGPALAHSLSRHSTPVRLVAEVLLWGAWAVAFGASLVPRSTSLTAFRALVPVGVVAAAWATADRGHLGAAEGVALAVTFVALVAALLPITGEAFADGSSYGPERRMILRPPIWLVAGPIEVVWAVAVAGVATGPLLLAARAWVAGGLAIAVGAPATWFTVRALHQLSRRWVVFVPSGFVLHDPLATPEPHLFVRRMVARLGPAEAATDAVDLTGGAIGLALEIDLTEPIELFRRTARRGTATEMVERVLFTPTRPAELLDEARSRRIRVG